MSKRKLEELQCTQCQDVLVQAYATEGKNFLCHKCFKFGSTGFELKILEPDFDFIFLKWVCPHLGAEPHPSSAIATEVQPGFVVRFLETIFKLGYAKDIKVMFDTQLAKTLKPVGFRTAFLLHGLRAKRKIKSNACITRGSGDIVCRLVFGRQELVDVLSVVCSTDIKPLTRSSIPPQYDVLKQGNKHFVVSP